VRGGVGHGARDNNDAGPVRQPGLLPAAGTTLRVDAEASTVEATRALTLVRAALIKPPMLRENPMFKKMIATGEEQMSKIASQLLGNEKFMGALQKTVSAALDVKATAERAAQTALSAMNVPTATDVKKLEGKIEELEKVFESLSQKIAELQKKDAAPPPAAH
jgi:hypothetical protein